MCEAAAMGPLMLLRPFPGGRTALAAGQLRSRASDGDNNGAHRRSGATVSPTGGVVAREVLPADAANLLRIYLTAPATEGDRWLPTVVTGPGPAS
jgi:hypothetical protein